MIAALGQLPRPITWGLENSRPCPRYTGDRPSDWPCHDMTLSSPAGATRGHSEIGVQAPWVRAFGNSGNLYIEVRKSEMT